MADLLCMGEPLLEFSAQMPGQDGKTTYLQGFGGDASNVAIAAARQGASVGMITAMGEDFAGDAFFSLWRQEGIDCGLVRRDSKHPTGVYFVTHDSDGHHFFYLRKDSAAARFGPEGLPEQALAHARIFFASGISLAVSARSADAALRAITLARAHQVKVAIDPNYRAALWPAPRAAALTHAAMSEADIALPTLEDATALSHLSAPDAILDFYLRLGAKTVLLKLGAAGAIVATSEARAVIPALPVNVIDATGAGDALSGSFLARMLAGDPPEAAARYAVVAASLSTTGLGAVAPIPRAEEVRAVLAQK